MTEPPMRWFLSGLKFAVMLSSASVLVWLVLTTPWAEDASAAPRRLEDIPFDGARAYSYLQKICDIGPRPSGSAGMKRQQAYLTEHFRALGGLVTRQEFRARHPVSGEPVEMANLIVQWRPRSRERILLCAHYDTRPFPDQDKKNPNGVFIGANDGASGVALLMELAHDMPKLDVKYGVDFVLFDGEEFVYRSTDKYFLGSEHFAIEHAQRPPAHRYRWGVLLDMVGDADLRIYQERNSLARRPTRPLVYSLWRTARRLGVREFVARPKYEIRDDHLPLNDIAKIPTCAVIDFDFPHWHTEGDTPDKCSALSLAKVGWVVKEWLKKAP